MNKRTKVSWRECVYNQIETNFTIKRQSYKGSADRISEYNSDKTARVKISK